MKRIALCALFVLLTISCSDSTTVFETEQADVSLETNAAVLDKSISYTSSGVLDIYDQNQTEKTSKSPEEQAGDYPLTLVAQVNAPSYNSGDNLTASHVHLAGNYAYVSYNTPEGDYAGALDIIDIRDPLEPRVSSRLYYTNADLNALQYDNGYLYAVGGVDSEKSVRATANSFVAKIEVNNGRFYTSSGIQYGFQEGFVGNDILVTPNSVLMTSGKDGYVTEFDKQSLEIIQDTPYADLRSLAVHNNKIAVLDASYGVRFLDQNFNETAQFPINSDFRVADKRTIDFSDDRVVVAEGANGTGIYNPISGDLIEYVPIPINPANVDPTHVVTNATALNEDILLMANGGAGLCLSEDNNGVDMVGIIALEGSINYVASKGDFIFAASGESGLQIIKLNRPDNSLEGRCAGTPAYDGRNVLNVAASENLAFKDTKRFKEISVDGNLLLCGTWTVRNKLSVNENGSLQMRGTIYIGRNRSNNKVTVGKNATLTIEGNLVVYGDLVLEDGATLEFLGDNAKAYIFGAVESTGNAKVNGDFDDVYDKF